MPSAEGAPVSDAEAVELFAPLRDLRLIALAVSGGPDSTALVLAHARARAVDARLPEAVVLTVDHRLRAASATEADAVAALAARHGLAHRTLVWDGAKPAANLQAEARRARYDLLVDAARDLGAGALLTAHHADDQAETFLARLARGSGVLGLAAMARSRRLDGLLLFRPFLDLPKARLVATVAAHGETWVEDPSNADPRFDRARLRAAAPLLADLGLSRDRLVATARAMARAARMIEDRVDVALAAAVVLHHGGWAVVDPAGFAALPEEVRLRLLSRLVRAVGGATYGPRLGALETLAAALAAVAPAERLAGRTLGGVVVEQRRGRIFLAPEPGRGEGPRLELAPGGRGRFRGRRVELDATAPGPVTVAALGAAGRRAITAATCLGPAVLGDPAPTAAVIESAPALFVAGRLVAFPAVGFVAEGGEAWGRAMRIAALAP